MCVCVCAMLPILGYFIAQETKVALKHVLPIDRSRWLAVFVHQNSAAHFTEEQNVVIRLPASSGGLSLFRGEAVAMHLSPEQRSELEPSPETIALLSDPESLPPTVRGELRNVCDALVWRVKTKFVTPGSPMASYGHQHELPRKVRLERDDPRTNPRYFHPWEVAVMLGFPPSAKIMMPLAEGWKHIGNSIAPVHAAFVTLVTLCVFGAKLSADHVHFGLRCQVQWRVLEVAGGV